MIIRRLHPAPTDAVPPAIDSAAPTARASLAQWYAAPRKDWVRLNLVASVGGSAAGSDGTSETLTNPVDRMILGVIRELSDVVVVGAASVRAEGYFVPRSAALAIVTHSGDLSGHQITQRADRGPLLVLCARGAVERVRATTTGLEVTVVTVDSASASLTGASIISALHGQGFDRIVCEGGPTLAARLIADDLIDEFCLTTSARLSPRALPLFSGTPLPERSLELHALAVDDESNVYARWLFPGRQPAED